MKVSYELLDGKTLKVEYDSEKSARFSRALIEETIVPAVKNYIKTKPVEKSSDDDFGDSVLVCPSCGQPIVNVWNKKDYKPNFCHYCGQGLCWDNVDVDLEDSSCKEKLCFAVDFFKSGIDACFIQYPTTDEALKAYTRTVVESSSYGVLTVFCFAENRDEAIKIASKVKEDFLARKDKCNDSKISEEEVVHSRWKICCDGWYPYCSNCNYEPPHDTELPKVCPNCKAIMYECNLDRSSIKTKEEED